MDSNRRIALKKTVYFIILAISISLVFSQGKPCCKNKAGKGKVACKFNLTDIGAKKDVIISNEETRVTEKSDGKCAYSTNVSSSIQKKCSSCKTAPWWKFWAKKKNCCNSNA